MKIALASPPIPKNLSEGLFHLEAMVKEASAKSAEIICFPESYLPGYPGMGYPATDRSPDTLQASLKSLRDC